MRTKEQGAGGLERKSGDLLFVPEDFLPSCHTQDYLEPLSSQGNMVLDPWASLWLMESIQVWVDSPMLGEGRQARGVL